MRQCVLCLCFWLLFSSDMHAQYLQIGDGNYLGLAAGPMITNPNASSYTSRYAYIWPRSVLGNMQHGDTITSIELNRASGVQLNSTANLKIYIKNTTLNDFGSGPLAWANETGSLSPVYNQNPASDLGVEEGFHRLDFSGNGFMFDTTHGENLELLFEFTQTSAQSDYIFWYFETSSTLNGFSANQMKSGNGTTLRDTLKTSADYHPVIVFNYPRYDNDIALIKVYSLGKIPIPLGNPDSVKILARNIGKKDQNNVKLNTWLQGVNTGLDSSSFSIKAKEQKFVNIPSLDPRKMGLDTVYAAITNDMNSFMNEGYSIRLNNENIYSYRDVTLPPDPGGIGFNDETGDFVARFYSNKSKAINQVTVNFYQTGSPFKIGIWDNSGTNGQPGQLLYLSSQLSTVAGNYILNLKQPVSVNGTFYVGVRQLDSNNIGFGYQMEVPVRPGTFFYTSPAGSTTWYDFAPDAPFKFIIEPRLQGDTDLAVLSADFPKDSIDRYTTDTLAPKATVANLGVKDIADSFDIHCRISYFGKIVYDEVLRDTMSSGQKRVYTFPKSFFPVFFGEHELMVSVHQSGDRINDNDTAVRKFYVGVKKDVMVSNVFDPPQNGIYEYLTDTVFPAASVQNPGYDNTVPFTARCRIYRGNSLLYDQSQVLSLAKFGTRILSWKPYQCVDTGHLKVVFTVDMPGDAYRLNDTIIRDITVFKSYDIIADSVLLPSYAKFYTPKNIYYPTVRLKNDGVLPTPPVNVICRINNPSGIEVYRDTVSVFVDGKSDYIFDFKRKFIPAVKGKYEFFLKATCPQDLVNFNDSLKQFFNVGYPHDYFTQQIIFPKSNDTLSVGGGPFQCIVKMGNNGFDKTTDLCPVVLQIWRNGQQVYQDIKSLNLDTGSVYTLNFSNNFNPINAGKYDIIVYTNYVSDDQRKNDSTLGYFYVTVGKDAFVSEITQPLDSSVFEARKDSVFISVLIHNDGSLSIDPLKVYAEIYYNGNLVFFDKMDDGLGPLMTHSVSFGKHFVPADTGKFHLLCYTYSDQDQNIRNDSQSSVFYAIKSKDIQIIKWNEPLPGSTYTQGTGNLKTSVNVMSSGRDTAGKYFGKVFFEYFELPGNKLIYRDSGTFNGLSSFDDTSVIAIDSLPYPVPGQYLVRAYTNAQDLFPENDTLYSAFEILVNGVERIKRDVTSVFPNPADRFIRVVTDVKFPEIFVYDSRGRLMYQGILSDNVIQTGNWAAGIYELKIVGQTNSTSVRFLINHYHHN